MDFLKAFKDTAATLGLGKLVADSPGATEARVKKEADKKRAQGKRRKGQPYGSIIAYRRTGPFFRQEGVKAVPLPSGAVAYQPVMRKYFVHAFLHATKGWRITTHIPASMRGA